MNLREIGIISLSVLESLNALSICIPALCFHTQFVFLGYVGIFSVGICPEISKNHYSKNRKLPLNTTCPESNRLHEFVSPGEYTYIGLATKRSIHKEHECLDVPGRLLSTI